MIVYNTEDVVINRCRVRYGRSPMDCLSVRRFSRNEAKVAPKTFDARYMTGAPSEDTDSIDISNTGSSEYRSCLVLRVARNIFDREVAIGLTPNIWGDCVFRVENGERLKVLLFLGTFKVG